MESRIPNTERELFIIQSMKWMNRLGMKSYIISFGDYSSLITEKTDEGVYIFLPGEFDKDYVLNWIKLLKPKLIHVFGEMTNILVDTTSKLRIPVIVGYHSLDGLIDINPSCLSSNLLSSKHKKSSRIDQVLCNRYTTSYVCSEFLQEVVSTVSGINMQIVCSSSSITDTGMYENPLGKYVTQIGLTTEKGGSTFHHIVNSLFDIPFIGVKNKGDVCDELDGLFSRKRDGSIIIDYTTDINTIYSKTRILISPSLIDEISCRVLVEGLCHGIPIISSGRGNSKYVLGTSSIIIDTNRDEWVSKIANLYFDKESLEYYSKKSRERYLEISEKMAMFQFHNLVRIALKSSKDYNILLLGSFQTKPYLYNFISVLKERYNVFVFNYLPYNAKVAELFTIEYDQSYSSNHTNRTLIDDEIISYITTNNIGKSLLFDPEENLFSIGNILKQLNVLTYVIPDKVTNEFYRYRVYDKILCTSYYIENLFKGKGFSNTMYVGYFVQTKERNSSTNTYNFICLDDSYTSDVVKSFNKINTKSASTMTIIGQSKIHENQNIKVINDLMTHKEIEHMFSKYDTLITLTPIDHLHFAKYALASGLSIITFDTEPFNEVSSFGWICKTKEGLQIDIEDMTKLMERNIDRRERKRINTKGLVNRFQFLLYKAIW